MEDTVLLMEGQNVLANIEVNIWEFYTFSLSYDLAIPFVGNFPV